MPKNYHKEAAGVDWSKHDKAPATCPECKKVFEGHEAYLQHWRETHDDPAPKPH